MGFFNKVYNQTFRLHLIAQRGVLLMYSGVLLVKMMKTKISKQRRFQLSGIENRLLKTYFLEEKTSFNNSEYPVE